MTRLAVCSLFAPLLLPACIVVVGDWGQVSAEAERDSSHPLAGATELRVESRNGSITVVRGEGDTVECHALMSASAGDYEEAAELAAAMRVEATRTGDGLRLKVVEPRGGWRHWGASLRLAVPAGVGLSLATSNGHLEIGAGFGPVRADTSNASVRLAGGDADFAIRTSNGHVEVELPDGWAGNGSVETSNGGISVRCDGRLRCAVAAATSNGRVHRTRPDASGQEVGRLVLATSNASIRVEEN